MATRCSLQLSSRGQTAAEGFPHGADDLLRCGAVGCCFSDRPGGCTDPDSIPDKDAIATGRLQDRVYGHA